VNFEEVKTNIAYHPSHERTIQAILIFKNLFFTSMGDIIMPAIPNIAHAIS